MTTFNRTLFFYLLLLIMQDLEEELKKNEDSKSKVKSILYFNQQFNEVLSEIFIKTQNKYFTEDFSDGLGNCKLLLQENVVLIKNDITTQLFNDFILFLFKDVPNVYAYQIINLYSSIIRQNWQFFNDELDLLTDVKIRVQ